MDATGHFRQRKWSVREVWVSTSPSESHVFLFSTPAIKFYHTLSSIKQYGFITLQSRRPEVQPELKLRCCQGCSGENLFLCHFQLLHTVTFPSSRLPPPSAKPAMTAQVFLIPHISLTLPASSSFSLTSAGKGSLGLITHVID